MSRPVLNERTLVNDLVFDTSRYVKALRLRHGLTARALATELDSSSALIYRIEETGGMYLETLRRILTWHRAHPMPKPCPVPTCWLGKGHDGPHEDHS